MAAPVPPPIAPPLGLPPGSVRATIALVLCVSLWYQVLADAAASEALVSAALLVVAFYFGVRSTAPPSAPVIATALPTRQPLFLPRGMIRGFLMLGFFGVILYAYSRGRGVPEAFILILQVLTSYLVGLAIAKIVSYRRKIGKAPSRAVAAFRHLNAFAAIGLTAYVCGTILFAWVLPYPQYTSNALPWIVAYYFGSRVGP